MTEAFSIDLDFETKRRLDALSEKAGQSSAVLAEEAIVAYLDLQEWQRTEIEEALLEAENGDVVPHEDVVKWMRSWGTPHELKPPR